MWRNETIIFQVPILIFNSLQFSEQNSNLTLMRKIHKMWILAKLHYLSHHQDFRFSAYKLRIPGRLEREHRAKNRKSASSSSKIISKTCKDFLRKKKNFVLEEDANARAVRLAVCHSACRHPLHVCPFDSSHPLRHRLHCVRPTHRLPSHRRWIW